MGVMTETSRRPPTGAAVLQPHVTTAISEAVLDELAEQGYARLSMEGVAKRAGVGKSALYRRWPGKQEMVVAVLSEYSVPLAAVPDTGSLRTDVRATVQAVHDWLTHPLTRAILPDLVAEGARNPDLAQALTAAVGDQRRNLGAATLHRAIDRGELPADVDLELALDFLAAPTYWRAIVRATELSPDYLDRLTTHILRALNATPK